MSEKLLVGYGRADISPKESVPLRGYGSTSKRMSAQVIDPLDATCLAFTDEAGESVLLFALDLIGASERWEDRYAPAISKATGVPAEHIFGSGSHTHSAPDYTNKEKDSIPRYLDLLEEQLVAAAVAAMADRKEAEIFATSAKTTGLNFVRRYVLEDGTPAGDNYGHFDQSPIKCHESEVDNQMQFVKFVREGKKDIIMVNFQTHPHRTGGGGKRYDVSADIVGVMRDETEKQLGCDFIYFSGGSGNVNPISRVPEENIYTDHLEHGKAMADVAVSVEGTYKPVSTGAVKVETRTLTCPVNHTLDHRIKDAEYISSNFKATGDRPTWTAEAKKLGFNSVYQANAIIKRSKGPATMDMVLHAISMGDLAFVNVPYEMFDTNGKQIKDNSPFKVTYVLTCGAGEGYIPSELGFKNGGYSVDNCWFMPGVGELFANTLLDSLNDLHQ